MLDCGTVSAMTDIRLTFSSKSLSKNESMNSALTKGKLKYTPYELGKPKN